MLSRASNLFGDLGQFKAYLREIDSFDKLYIIQQGGRGVKRKQIIDQLERAIAKDAESVFESNESLWRQFNISSGQQLKKICDSQGLSSGSHIKSFPGVITLTY